MSISRGRLVGGATVSALGVITVTLFGLSSRVHERAIWHLASGANPVNVDLPVGSTAYLAGFIGILAGVVYAGARHRRALRHAAVAVACLGTLVAMLTWAAAGQSFSLTELLQGTVGEALPILLGALAGILCERVGVINVALEGQMLAGAWAAAMFASIASSLMIGLASAALAGALVGALLAVFAIRYLVDQVVLGIVLNILVLGITGFFYDGVMTTHQDTLNNPPVFGTLRVPLVSGLPVIGAPLFQGSMILFLAYGLLAAVHFGLFRTRWGLRLRAVGEHPVAAMTVGIRVRRTRYGVILIGGVIAGIAGATFTIGGVGAFGPDITSGTGFIALAAVIFGRWRPMGSLVAALLFGFTDAAQNLLATLNTPIPTDLLQMAPYAVTVVVVAGLIGHARGPAAAGKPFMAP